MKKALMVFLSFMVALSFSLPASAAVILKLGTPAPPKHPAVKSLYWMADYVKKHTNGEVIIQVFPLGQLGSVRSMAEQVQSGTLDMAELGTAVMSNYVKPTGLLDLPFLWPSRGVAYSVLGDTDVKNIISDALKKKGFIFVGWAENEWRDFSNVKRPVSRPEHVKGMKVRVMEAPVFLDTWRALGANPVGTPFPEVYTSLQQGVIDAQENPLMTSYLMKFTEVTPHLTVLQYSLTSAIKAISIDAWNKLTKEQQEVLLLAGRLGTQVNREGGMNLSMKLVAKLNGNGKNKITRLSKEERAEWVKAVQPVYAKHEKRGGKIPNDKEKYGRYAGMTYLKMIQAKIKQYQ
jgi:TRAP-type transport system periplasmic protein